MSVLWSTLEKTSNLRIRGSKVFSFWVKKLRVSRADKFCATLRAGDKPIDG